MSYDNAGRAVAAPAGMVFVVYTALVDEGETIFDWDWVEADPNDKNLPLDHADRYGERIQVNEAATLDAQPEVASGSFDPSAAVYSTPGDCLFAYIAATPSYAVRINEDLTVFRAFDTRRPVGCKVKNVSVILKELRATGNWSTETKEIRVELVVAASHAAHLAARKETRGYAEIFAAFEEAEVPPELWVPPLLQSGGPMSARR